MPATVEAVLKALDASAHDIEVGDPRNFAFNVLLNALLSVMEGIRAESPDAFREYQVIALVSLQDD